MRFHGGAPGAVAAMASDPSTQSRVMFQATEKTDESSSRRLGKLTVKYNRKDLQRRLDIEEWIDEQLHLLYDCEVGEGCLGTESTHTEDTEEETRREGSVRPSVRPSRVRDESR